MRKFITLLIGIFYLATNLHSQELGYDNNSRWFWGLNAGGTWHTSDVKSKTAFGLGMTVGRSFNYDYGKKVSFDVRGRLLYGEWLGIDRKRSDFTVPNAALSSGATNYKDSLGYAFRNFYNQTAELSLELVVHLNALRERTGADAYIFGGVGYSWFNPKGNYLNTDNAVTSMYDFASWEENLTKKEYMEMLDSKAETLLDGALVGKKNVKIMPSLGFGLGYQFAPRFSAGFEHKTTFTGLDFYDGVVDQTSFIKNDWYHYTSIYLQFHIKPSKGKRTTNSTTHTNSNLGPDRNDKMEPPRVQFTNPPTPGTTTTLLSYNIRGDVKNVYNRQDLSFKHNGREVTNFNYNTSTGKFDSQVTLSEGENTFELIGRNVYGTDRATTDLNQRKPDPVPPIVTFQNPSFSPRDVNTSAFDFQGTVLYVDQKSQVRLEVNGNVQSNFTFNAVSKQVRANLNLNYGTNVVQLTGTNAVGTDSKTTIIIYNRDNNVPMPNPNQNRQPPVVYFTNPGSSPTTVGATSMTLDAKVLYVMNKQSVTFKQNGQVNYNFNFNAATGDFRSTVSLVSGQNVFEIIGTNQHGSAQATTIIIYQRQAYNPPVVTINNPSTNPYTASQEDLNFIATVLNVSSKNQVEVKVNGQVTNNFTFVNSTVSSNIRLGSGTTVIDVKGTNQDGTDQKQTTVIYRKPTVQNPPTQVPPIVYFTNPGVNPFTVNASSITLDAKVINVANQQNVTFKQNGQLSTNFTFNAASQDFRSTVTLNYGQNVFEITGTNQHGTAQATTVVVYERTAKNPPVVTISSPNANPYSTDQGSVNFLATVLNVSAKNQVEVKVNGQVTSDFTFVNNVVNATILLTQGSTVIEVKGTNQDGVDQKQTTVNYRKPVAYTPKPPVVTILTPDGNPYISPSEQVSFTATVLNVTSKNQVQVKLNGALLTNFTFINSLVQASVQLAAGANTIEVIGTNQDGSDKKETKILYRKPIVIDLKVIKPIVEIITPATNPATTNVATYNAFATVKFVDNESGVDVKVNGVKVTRLDFDPATSNLKFAASLKEGSNVIVVTGTNAVGSDSKTTTLIYDSKPAVDKPAIVFTNPMRCPASFEMGPVQIKGNIANVTNAQQVVFTVGGIVVTNAKTEMKNGKLEFTIPLTVSYIDFTIQVDATNGGGTASASCLIKPVPASGPTKPATPTVRPTVKPTVKPAPKTPVVKPIVVPAPTKEPKLTTPPDRVPTVDPNVEAPTPKPERTGTTTPVPKP